MSESIFSRMSRILSASIEDAIDRLEAAGGPAVMREAIREAERAIDQAKAELDGITVRRLQAARQQQLLAKRIEDLGGKAAFAVGEGREDLAEAALSRQIDFEAQAKALEDVQAQVRSEEAELEPGLAALVERKRQMEEALAAFEISKREAGIGPSSMPRGHSPGQRLDVAEKAFERAMKGAGGVGFTPAEAGTIQRVAEIDALQKSAAVAHRLAALKAGRAA
jgi:phage shock protein A